MPRQPIIDEEIEEAPIEKIDQALNQINQELTIDLLQRLTAATPLFFERSVLELMHAMGYAGVEAVSNIQEERAMAALMEFCTSIVWGLNVSMSRRSGGKSLLVGQICSSSVGSCQ